jgi:protein kinase-like protein
MRGGGQARDVHAISQSADYGRAAGCARRDYGAFLDSGDWPIHAYLESKLEADGIELNDTLAEMPAGLFWPDPRARGAVWFSEDERLGLRVAGLALCRGSDAHLEMFLVVLRWLVEQRRSASPASPQDAPRVERRSVDLIEPLRAVTGGDPLVRDVKLMLELMNIEPGLPSWAGDPNDFRLRTFAVDREIRRFRDVETIEQFVEIVSPRAAPQTGTTAAAIASGTAVDLAADVPAAQAARPARRRRKYRHAVGERFGRWTLQAQLGAGGNAEVWRGLDEDTGEIAAVKILHADRTDEDAYARFRREIDSIGALADEGARVLPIIDYFLPEDIGSAEAWYAMPEAIGIRDALGRAGIVERVAALAEIADELARLAERDWHHRDVKPANLYSYKGRFVVGDFGLIKRPSDDDLTRVGRTPGPYEYLPNEAVMRADTIDLAAFDLFCLAKTIWGIVTGNPRPPQGHIAAASYWSLSKQFEHEQRIDELDRLLDRATSDNPSERGTLRAFADGLAAWAAGNVDQQASAAEGPGSTEPELEPTRSRAQLPSLVEAPESPAELERLVVTLLREDDLVGLRELLRQERRGLEEAVHAAVGAQHGNVTYGDVAAFWREASPSFERVFATTIPLIEHHEDLWSDQLRWMTRYADTRLFESGLVIWIEMPRWCGWLFANACGAYATVDDRFDILSTLLTTAGPVLAEDGVPLGLILPGDGGAAVGQGMLAELEPNGPRYFVPFHEYTLRYLSEMEWLAERYPEFAGSREKVVDAFDNFSFLAGSRSVKGGEAHRRDADDADGWRS